MNIANRIKEFEFIWYQLTRPLSYLKIKHDDKWIYDWMVPLLFTLASILIATKLIGLDGVTNDGGLIDNIVQFISNLPGFFIAALAAVATFNKDDIDKTMDNPPRIEIIAHGNVRMIEMTRRRFLCVLFSYLTAISIFIVIFTRMALAIEYGADNDYFAWIGVTLFFFIFWQMITATVLGLYYLGERLHTPQSVI